MAKGISFQGTPSSASAVYWEAITPHASTNFANGQARGIYVGVGGDVVLVAADGSIATFKNAPSGSVIPCAAIRVNAVNTTATNLVALY